MARNDISVKFDIEPVCKVLCLAKDCQFKINGGQCNFKHIQIDSDGKCTHFKKQLATNEGAAAGNKR